MSGFDIGGLADHLAAFFKRMLELVEELLGFFKKDEEEATAAE